MHGMSLSRLQGYVQANYQQPIPNSQITFCNMHKLHEWSKKMLWQRFWICALNRWSVRERVLTSFCPIACQVLHYLAWELCRQIAAWILTELTPFLLVWEVRKGRWGGGVSFSVRCPKFTRDCQENVLRLLGHTYKIYRLRKHFCPETKKFSQRSHANWTRNSFSRLPGFCFSAPNVVCRNYGFLAGHDATANA